MEFRVNNAQNQVSFWFCLGCGVPKLCYQKDCKSNWNWEEVLSRARSSNEGERNMRTKGENCITGFSPTGNCGSSVPLNSNHLCQSTDTTWRLVGAHLSKHLIPTQPRLSLHTDYPNSFSLLSLQSQMLVLLRILSVPQQDRALPLSLVLPEHLASWCFAFTAFTRTQLHLCFLPTCWLKFAAESLPLCSKELHSNRTPLELRLPERIRATGTVMSLAQSPKGMLCQRF